MVRVSVAAHALWGRLASRRLCTFSRVPVAETLERGQLVCSGPGQRWTRLGRGNGAPRHRGGVHCHPMGAGSGPPALSVSHRLGALQPSWEGTAGPMGPAFPQAPWSPVCSMRPGNPAGETPLWAASAADPTRSTPCSRGLRKGAPTAGSEPASRAFHYCPLNFNFQAMPYTRLTARRPDLAGGTSFSDVRGHCRVTL